MAAVLSHPGRRQNETKDLCVLSAAAGNLDGPAWKYAPASSHYLEFHVPGTLEYIFSWSREPGPADYYL